MKKLLILVFLSSVILSWAQAPEKINFQTVLHETDGVVLPNQNVKMIVNIISESANGDIVYREEHALQSNQFGLINFKIGTGEVLYGGWQDIMWTQEDQFVMFELDTSGSGSSYVDMGVAQMLSVPYALYANDSQSSYIWGENELGVYYLDGNVAIGQDSAQVDLVLAQDAQMALSSDMTNLEDNALLIVKMDADTAQPNIGWRDDNEIYKASISAENFTTDPLTSSKRFVLSTADDSDYRRSRLEIKYDQNIADLFIEDAKLLIENDFTSGDLSSPVQNIFWSHNWVNDAYQLGVGDKNWSVQGVYGDAAAESYTNGSDNFVLLNSADELNRSQLIMRRGNAEWKNGYDGSYYIKRNDSRKLRIMDDGKVKIGGSDPEFKLDVYGDVNIPVGYSYLVNGGKSSGKYAEYFESEETVETGAPVGMNLASGLVRNYQQGDVFVGIACEPTGFIANAQYHKNDNYILVGLEGLMDFNNSKSQVINQQVFTSDGEKIGTLIGEKVFLK